VHRLAAWVEHRNAPVVATVGMLVVGLAFSLFGLALLHGGSPRLFSPSDLWSLASSSSALVHGHVSHIYVTGGALTSPPALEVVLAPVILIGQATGLDPHLHASGEPLSMWFVLGPAALLIGSTSLFAVDAVARYWRMSEPGRLALALAGAVAVGNVVIRWGHPEDCVSLALVVWAALDLERHPAGRGSRAAWILGLAIAFQPLAVLGVAPVLARVGWRQFAPLSYRLLVPTLVVLVPPLIGQAHQTIFVLVHQPFQTRYVSLTPLSHWAPSLGGGLSGGGPTRLVATAIGAGLGVAVCRRRHDLDTVLALTTVGFFLRVLLETELNWYYIWPLTALCLLLARRGSRTRFSLCAAAALAGLVLGDHRVHHIEVWWPALMGTTLVMLVTILPLTRPGPPGADPAVECDGMQAHAGSGLQHE
jgi:hypothetical protein